MKPTQQCYNRIQVVIMLLHWKIIANIMHWCQRQIYGPLQTRSVYSFSFHYVTRLLCFVKLQLSQKWRLYSNMSNGHSSSFNLKILEHLLQATFPMLPTYPFNQFVPLALSTTPISSQIILLNTSRYKPFLLPMDVRMNQVSSASA